MADLPEMQAVDEDGNPADLSVIERAGVAFDPSSQHMDLSKDEKRRTTALMLAINAYRELIIKEADYLKEASDLARRGKGPALKPATIDAMVEAAFKFDVFISSGALVQSEDATRGGQMTEQETESA